MRWFKHLTDAWTDEAMAQLIDKYGLEGYGLWWRILEIIGSKMEKGSDRCSVQYSVRKWQNLCGIYHRSRFNLITIFLQSLNKLDLIFDPSSDDLLTISCPNLLKFRDEYSRKSGQTPDKLRKKSGECQEQDTETELDTKKELLRSSARTGRNQSRQKVKPNGNGWEGITESEMDLWVKSYPAVDVTLELNKALAWVNANPNKHKKEWKRFLNNWMNRCQERGGSSPAGKFPSNRVTPTYQETTRPRVICDDDD
jgi:hypothetical protein